MSATMTLTMTDGSNCPNCGIGLPHTADLAAEAQRQIEDLQAQVRLLTQKATAAVDKWADYEDELRELRQQITKPTPTIALPPEPVESQAQQTVSNRLSYFLSSRKSTSNLKNPLPASADSPSTPREADLAAKLEQEKKAREKAEGKLDEASGELEELSAVLFQQANEMVATERKARAKLEERVALLERRDGEKRARLERLEKAVGRIERVREMLGQ